MLTVASISSFDPYCNTNRAYYACQKRVSTFSQRLWEIPHLLKFVVSHTWGGDSWHGNLLLETLSKKWYHWWRKVSHVLFNFTSHHMEISRNEGSPKSSILIGFSLVNHPFWGTSIYGNPHIAPDAEKTRGQSQNQTSSLGPGLRHQHLVRPSQLQKLPQMALANICNSFIQSVLRNLGNHIPVGQKSPHGDCLLKAPFFQWEFQDPKMEVLYHIRPYFGGISPYIALKNRPYIWNRYLQFLSDPESWPLILVAIRGHPFSRITCHVLPVSNPVSPEIVFRCPASTCKWLCSRHWKTSHAESASKTFRKLREKRLRQLWPFISYKYL